jgi:hypothetical protein
VLAVLLAATSAAMALGVASGAPPAITLVAGLGIFGAVFAVNSSVHSYLILAYSDGDEIAMNVGFYYMSNAGGRLAGTLLSGTLYELAGLPGCLWGTVAFAIATAGLSTLLPHRDPLTLTSEMEAGGGD